MSRKRTIALSAAALALSVTTALAFSNISLVMGTMPSYDFAQFGGPQPATVEFHTFTMKPGDTVPWHFHKALSYVVLERGTLTETHADPNTGACTSEEFGAGSAFIEDPNEVHTVSNTGRGAAVITWATAFPTSDGVLQLAPQFSAGGIYFSAPPNCN
jgi:quercetin dioxygenase-like cupin family protein